MSTVKFLCYVALFAVCISLLMLAGCASSVAVTGPQKLYALESEFDLAEHAIIAYEESPQATPAEVAKIRALNGTAHEALVAARATVGGANANATNAAIEAAQTALQALDAYLQTREARK